MGEFAFPRSDEPFDFRRQAAAYGRYRRDYSGTLYEAIEERAGRARGRQALDLGCGTGLVARALQRRGWTVVGVDFSAPMLDEARRAGMPVALVRAQAETLPLRAAQVELLTCATAFHWLAPAPTLAEMVRVLAPGGWAALFWRYVVPGEPAMAMVDEVLRRFVSGVPAGVRFVHPMEPFAGVPLVAEPMRCIESTLAFSAEEFHGFVSTVEWLRRLAGGQHGAFLAALRDELARCWPHGFVERNHEYLFLARKPQA